jgi:hypothetical protein
MTYYYVMERNYKEITAGVMYFSSDRPWDSYRTSSMMDVKEISEGLVTFSRPRLKRWSNFFKTYNMDTFERIDRLDWFRSPTWVARKIRTEPCIFSDDMGHMIGSGHRKGMKTHALAIGEVQGWNGQPFLIAKYHCSGVHMDGYVSAISMNNGAISAPFDTVKDNIDLITCRNCLSKLR